MAEQEAATLKLDQWKQAKEAERAAAAAAAAEEDGEDGVPAEQPLSAAAAGEDEEVEISKEEEELQLANSRFQDSEVALKAAEEALSTLTSAMEKPFVCYRTYWVEGLGSTVEAIEGVSANGAPVRATIWGHVAAPPPAEVLDEAVESPAAPSAPLEPPPRLYSVLKEACQRAGWDSKLSLLTTLEIELPPSLEGEWLSCPPALISIGLHSSALGSIGLHS